MIVAAPGYAQSGAPAEAATTAQTVAAEATAPPAPGVQAGPTQTPETQGASAEETRQGDIIVTAQRRAQSLQDVPVSVTAIDTTQIQQTFAHNLADFSKASPNFTIEGVGSVSRTSGVVFSRGIGFAAIDAIEPPVGTSIDGLFYAVNVGTLLNTFDVKQIEILKGPQGTLFGRNTTGGVLQITTNDPGPELSLSGTFRLGTFRRFDTSIAANLPINDTLSARIAVNTQHSAGAYINTYFDPATGRAPNDPRTGGDDNQAIRVKLKWTPDDNFTALLTAWYTRQAQDGPVGVNASGPTDRLYQRGRPGIGFPGGPTDRYVISRDDNGADNLKQKAGILDLNYRTHAGFDITSLTAYLDYFAMRNADFDASDLNLFTSRILVNRSQFSQELRLQSDDTDSPFQWQVGGFYFRTQYFTRQVNILGPSFSSQTTASSPVTNQFLGARTREASIAGFGQADLRLADRLVLTAGARYTHENKSVIVWPVLASLVEPFPAGLTNKNSWDDFTYHLAARFEFTRDLMMYASYSTGEKAGGFLVTATTQAQLDPYAPEKARAFEVGLRSQLFDRRLRLNLTGFWNNYDDLQVSAFRPIAGGSGQQSFIANSAFERARGVELEATVLPVDALRLSAAVGYLNARYTSFVAALSYNFPGHVCNALTGGTGSPPVAQDHADPNTPCYLVPPRSPDLTMRYDASYDVDLDGHGKLTPHANASYESGHFTNLTNAPQGFQNRFWLVNADLSFQSPDERFRLSVFVKNLNNESYLIATNPIAGLFTANYYSEPRTWGLELGVKF